MPVLDHNNDSEHLEPNLTDGSDIKVHSSRLKLLPKNHVILRANPNSTRSGRVFMNYQEPPNRQQFVRLEV